MAFSHLDGHLMCGGGSQPRRALVWHPQDAVKHIGSRDQVSDHFTVSAARTSMSEEQSASRCNKVAMKCLKQLTVKKPF